jgi:hypothetical protein
MKKQEIYVEITNEKERLRAIEILKKSGERVLNCSRLYKKDKTGNLSFSEQWSLPSFMFQLPRNLHKITLIQLEEMLIPKSIIGTQSNNPLFIAQRYIIDNFPMGTVVTITNGLIEVK